MDFHKEGFESKKESLFPNNLQSIFLIVLKMDDRSIL